MDKNDNVVIKEKNKKVNVVIITISIIVLIAGAFGIWWFSNQKPEEMPEGPRSDMSEMSERPEDFMPTHDLHRITYPGMEGRTAMDLLREQYAGRVEFELNADGVEVVKAIDGLMSDDIHSWELFVNDAPYEDDANTYVTTDTDIIEWRLRERAPMGPAEQ